MTTDKNEVNYKDKNEMNYKKKLAEHLAELSRTESLRDTILKLAKKPSSVKIKILGNFL